MQLQQQEVNSTPPSTTDALTKLNVDDEDDQVVFLNNYIEKETIDFEKSAQDKRNAKIDGKHFYFHYSFFQRNFFR